MQRNLSLLPSVRVRSCIVLALVVDSTCAVAAALARSEHDARLSVFYIAHTCVPKRPQLSQAQVSQICVRLCGKASARPRAHAP
eukprot:536283-Pleurochrysis_carterae.AAC.1